MQSRARATLENAGMHIENSQNGYQPEKERVRQPQPETPPHTLSDNDSAGSAHTGALNAHDIHNAHDAHTGNQHANAAYTGSKRKSQDSIGIHAPQRDEPPAVNMPGLNIALDSDQLMLMATIYLLVKDGADKWLILSLAYIMLT
jgi:hypothetical protein